MSDIDHMYLQQQLMKITLKKIASPSRNSNDKEKEKKKQKNKKWKLHRFLHYTQMQLVFPTIQRV